MNTGDPIYEEESFKLLSEAKGLLEQALDSIDANAPRDTIAEGYMETMAYHVNVCSDGYKVLRQAGHLASSTILIRPAVEATIFAQAVVNSPGVLLGRAYEEFEEVEDLCNRNPNKKEAKEAAQDRKAFLAKLEQEIVARHPGCELFRNKVSVSKAAKRAGLELFYEVVYSHYCKRIHGVLSELHEPEHGPRDNIILAFVVWYMTDLLSKHRQAKVDENRLRDVGKMVNLLNEKILKIRF